MKRKVIYEDSFKGYNVLLTYYIFFLCVKYHRSGPIFIILAGQVIKYMLHVLCTWRFFFVLVYI